MKSLVKIVLVIAVLSFSGCSGEFIEADRAINLVYPLADETCEDAELKPTNVEVPFRWTAQGEFNRFILYVNNQKTGETDFDSSVQEYEIKVPLKYQENYNWKVVGESLSNLDSEARKFSTPIAAENSNYAPLAVIFEDPITSPGQVILTWSAEDPDGPAETDELRFEVFLDEFDPPTTLRNSDTPRLTSITVQNLERKKYYVRVVAIDQEGNSSANTLSFDGE